MDAAEGLRRIRIVGYSILALGLLLDALALVGCLSAWANHGSPALLGFGVLGIEVSAFAAVILLGAWIVEGFVAAQNPSSE
ncbi:MAG TPA: hypothetical protein VK819_03950 [Acidobacteriaceae bacterium]|jgi:hypothetical protein|nr:hypothetical protein [Acidobacteriaceae bacterium]